MASREAPDRPTSVLLELSIQQCGLCGCRRISPAADAAAAGVVAATTRMKVFLHPASCAPIAPAEFVDFIEFLHEHANPHRRSAMAPEARIKLAVSRATLVLHLLRARPVWQRIPVLERHRVGHRRSDDPRSSRRVVENAQLPHISVLANIVASPSGSRPSRMPEALSESHGGRKADRLTFAARRTATAQSTDLD